METLNLGGPGGAPPRAQRRRRDETAILPGLMLRSGYAALRQLTDTISLSAGHR